MILKDTLDQLMKKVRGNEFVSGPTSTSQSADDDEGLRGTGWGEGGPVYLET